MRDFLDQQVINKIYTFEKNELKIILYDRYLIIRKKCLKSKQLKLFDLCDPLN